MINKLIKIYCFVLILPLRVSVFFINLIRRIAKGTFIDKVVSGFRTKLQNDFTKVIESAYIINHSKTSNTKLVYIDIGARDGLPALVSKNASNFETIILCEGEPEEAKKLRSQGYLVIDKFLADTSGNCTFFYIPGHAGASSLKRPGTPFLHLFSEKHYDIYTKYVEQSITTSTLDVELKKLNVQSIDFIKLDVQGSELSVIKGLTTMSPLFWEVEMLPLPTYQDTPYGVSISQELVSRGYICFRQNDRICKDGIYIYANELYMPNYATDFGRNLIINNMDKWRLMMELFDIKFLSIHIEKIIKEFKPAN